MQRRRVVVIDDDDCVREVSQVSLESVAGWEVAAASSGREGIALVRTTRPDVVILDVMMPEMDGPATLVQLLAHPATRDIPVIFLTAKIQASDRVRLLELGAAGVMAKPFNPMLLGQEIAELLGWPD